MDRPDDNPVVYNAEKDDLVRISGKPSKTSSDGTFDGKLVANCKIQPSLSVTWECLIQSFGPITNEAAHENEGYLNLDKVTVAIS